MTLTQTAILTKQIINITIISIVVSIVGFFGYKIWHAYYLSTLPPVEEKPDTKFGLLQAPDFPVSLVSSSNFSYTLDTTTGGLPKVGSDPGFEKIIKVYFVIKPYATFLSPDKSQSLAEKFNIINPPEILNETTYRFSQNNGSVNKTLTVNLDSGNFKYSKEATPSSEENLDPDLALVNGFERILQSLGIFKDDLKDGRTKIKLFRIAGDVLIQTDLRSEAKAAQVSLWPQPIDKKQIFTSNVNTSNIFATVIKSSENLENYLNLNFNYYLVDTSTFATYPIKTAEQAFDDLKSGKGVVILEPGKGQVSISSISLGYYMSENYSPYLLPIFIFEGPNFVSYIPAISSDFQK